MRQVVPMVLVLDVGLSICGEGVNESQASVLHLLAEAELSK